VPPVVTGGNVSEAREIGGDDLLSGDGDDRLSGGADRDTLEGVGGRDRFEFRRNYESLFY